MGTMGVDNLQNLQKKDQNLFDDKENGQNQMDMLQTGGFNLFMQKHKNATQQVSAKA